MSVRRHVESVVSPRDGAASRRELDARINPTRFSSLAGRGSDEPGASSFKFDISSIRQPESASKSTPSASVREIKTAFRSQDRALGDVMRLTALLEELRSKEKQTAERERLAYTQLQKVSRALLGERNSHEARIKSTTTDLERQKQTSAALTAQVAALQKVALESVPKQQLSSAVGTAMAAEAKLEEEKRGLEQELQQTSVACDQWREANLALTDELVSLNAAHQRVMREHEELDARLSLAVEEVRVAREARAEASVAAAACEQAPPGPELQAALAAAAARTEVAEAALARVEACGAPKLDPVEMHATYQQLRGRVLRLSAEIVAGGVDAGEMAGMTQARDELLAQAENVKAKYDRVFGPCAEAEQQGLAAELAAELAAKIVRTEVLGASAPAPAPAEARRKEERGRAPGALPPSRRRTDCAALLGAARGIGVGVSAPALLDLGCDVGATHTSPCTEGGATVEAGEGGGAPDGNSAHFLKCIVADLGSLMKEYTGGSVVPPVT